MKRYISLLVAVLAFVGCQDPIDDYYNGLNEALTTTPTQTILEYLEADPDYNDFVELLKTSGVIDTMNSNYMFTVFAPSNEALEAEGVSEMTDEEIVSYMLMHICSNMKTTTYFEEITQLRVFSDNYLSITQDSITLDYSVDGVLISEPNIRCTDGYIHKLDGVLLPRLTLYDWLLSLGDEYSMFKEALVMRTIYIFDEENSTLIGETNMGRPIYDSVFITYNDILEFADISDESGQFRLIVPDNDAIMMAYSDMADTYITRGMPVTDADTTEWMDWFLKAGIFDYSETGIETFEDSGADVEYSAYDLEFRPATIIMSESTRLSNGFGYTASKAYLPAYIPMEEIVMNPSTIRYYYFVIGGSNTSTSSGGTVTSTGKVWEGWDSWSTTASVTNAGWAIKDGYFTGVYHAQTYFFGSIPQEYTFKTCKRTGTTSSNMKLTEWDVVPGKYKFQACLYRNLTAAGAAYSTASLTDYAEISLNHEYVGYVTGWGTRTWAVDGQVMMDVSDDEYIYVGDTIGPVEFTISIYDPTLVGTLDAGTSYTYTLYSRFSIGDFVLTPYDNY